MRLGTGREALRRVRRFNLCPSKGHMASGPRVLFTELSLGRILRGIRGLRPGGRRPGRRPGRRMRRRGARGIVSVRTGPRVAFSSFRGLRFRINRVVTYRRIGGSEGLLYSRIGVKDRVHRVMSKVGTRCSTRRVINGGIVIIAGLGPTGLTKVLDRNVVLYTRSTSKGLSLVMPRGRVPTNTRVYWM